MEKKKNWAKRYSVLLSNVFTYVDWKYSILKII